MKERTVMWKECSEEPESHQSSRNSGALTSSLMILIFENQKSLRQRRESKKIDGSLNGR
jgi:hypothetical protein